MVSHKSKIKILSWLLIVTNIFLIVMPIQSFSAENSWWDKNWSYSKQITVPIDTSIDIAKFQPIDIRLDFENKCWAKDTKQHSIRVCCFDDTNWEELESQIYNLEYSSDNYISGCSLVFLIPEFAKGNEKYYVYYDDSEKPDPSYTDHVDLEESYYRYEPIPGYPLESYFYKIIDSGYIIYAVSQKGQLMGYNTGQHVTKMKEDTTEVLPKNGDLFAAFDFKYVYDEGVFSYSSTSQKLVSKEIKVDGNLMVEFGIVTTSSEDDLKTAATYKYYYCPTKNTRIHIHAKHETLEEIEVYKNARTDGTYASLQCGGVKSNSIGDLNFGNILPNIHHTDEMNNIAHYEIDTDPEYIPIDPDIRILKIQDDVDLGEKPWICFDEGELGTSHAVIFSSDSVLKAGNNERDGIQLNSFEMDYPHFPGLENNIATIQAGRNSFEIGENHDLIIPADFIAEFDAEFFSSQNGGYKIVDEEAEIFQELVKIKPEQSSEIVDDVSDLVTHDLEVFAHLAPSFPFGSSISAILGINFSYLSAELYKDGEFINSGTLVRLPMRAIEEFGNAITLSQVISVLSMFDWKNVSFFKSIIFKDLIEGKYVVKLFIENPILGKERKFIGFSIIDLKKDVKTHIFARSEASTDISVLDQNNQEVEGAEILLEKDNVIIAEDFTNNKGFVNLKAPYILDSYVLKVFYKGSLVHEESIKLKLISQFFSTKKSIKIERFNLDLKITDSWQQSPDFELKPILLNEDSEEKVTFNAEKISNSDYKFSNIAPGKYKLNLRYKSYTVEREIQINNNENLNIEFLAEFEIKLKTCDSRGLQYSDAKVTIEKNGKKLILDYVDSLIIASIPPGNYKLQVYKDGDLVGSRKLAVFGDYRLDVITNHESFYPLLIIIACICSITISLFISYLKKEKKYFLTILPISTIVLSLVYPWWNIFGSNNELITSTNMYVIPTNLVTINTISDTISGETAYIPEIFISLISLFLIFSISAVTLTIVNYFFIKNKKIFILTSILSILFLVGSIGLFTIGMNALSETGLGSFIGQGTLSIKIPGESDSISVLSNWGPGIGFYLSFAAPLVILINLYFNKLKLIWEKYNGKKERKE